VNVQVRLFAVARELAGVDSVEVSIPAGGTVADLRRELAAQVPALAGILPQVLFAVGSNYVPDANQLTDDAEVACIPPVSGG
jgi:molybdopterin synthase catalytic subunit/molybdopterin synthase sulfur carrier subunit